MGDAWFRQEYLCEFVATESQMFDPDLVKSAIMRPTFGPYQEAASDLTALNTVPFARNRRVVRDGDMGEPHRQLGVASGATLTEGHPKHMRAGSCRRTDRKRTPLRSNN